ncbi:DUF1489 family protein [Pseudahrensia aquimaris]|uniref:DUF1489 family protein n=1 Tax=Pseudahrensia aquimaris TaxID=744461 RepID=A0ABW3FMX5_9HYPH
MALHILKLSVGTESLEDKIDWSKHYLKRLKAAGHPPQLFHTTRMVPKRIDEILDGGSIYWVIKGQVQCRQAIVDIEPFTDGHGIKRCHLVLDNKIIATQWQPKRAFQGWRYLKPEDAPADLGADAAAIPTELKAELSDLGLL